MRSENSVALCDARPGDCTNKGVLAHVGVIGMEFSLDGRRILTASDDDIRVWDVATKRALTSSLPGNTFAGLSPDGTSLFAVTGGELYRVPLLSIDDADAARLANMGDALAGVRIDRLGVTETVDGTKVLAGMEERCRGVAGPACDLIRWFRTAPEKRTISPTSNLTIADYVKRRRMVDDSADEWWRLKALFPNEPSLGPNREVVGAQGRN